MRVQLDFFPKKLSIYLSIYLPSIVFVSVCPSVRAHVCTTALSDIYYTAHLT